MSSINILVINPGSTSTKVALYNKRELLFEQTLRHSSQEIISWGTTIYEQYPFRRDLIVGAVSSWGVSMSDISVVIGRGGLLRPIPSGVYEVNDSMINDLKVGIMGQHASNLGGIIAADIAKEVGCKAYIADPVVVDEMSEVAHIGGHPLFPRKSIFHALNQKAVGRDYAEHIDHSYQDLNLIVAHMGGGVSVGAHLKGRVIDVNNALDGEGAFSPERSGTIPAGDLLRAAYSGDYSYNELYSMIVGRGGFVSHLDSNDVKGIVESCEAGDSKAVKIVDAFCYNVAKQIVAMAVPLNWEVDAIILTGGIAYNGYICTRIEEAVSKIAPVVIFAGEDEMLALAANAIEAYTSPENVKVY